MGTLCSFGAEEETFYEERDEHDDLFEELLQDFITNHQELATEEMKKNLTEHLMTYLKNSKNKFNRTKTILQSERDLIKAAYNQWIEEKRTEWEERRRIRWTKNKS